MGNVVSRCVQNVRNTFSSCSRKHTEDEPMLTSTCDSEAADKYNGPCLDPSVSLIDRTGDGVTHGVSDSSLVACGRSEYLLKSSTPKSHPKHGSKGGYQSLTPKSSGDCATDDDPDVAQRLFVDRGIQTAADGWSGGKSTESPGGLSKEFIIKTYSIKNATPSPTIPSKFTPRNRPRPAMDELPHSDSDGSQSSICHAQLSRTSTHLLEGSSNMSFDTPLDNLLHRQENVLSKLEDLQNSVTTMAQKYNVSALPSSAASQGQIASSKGMGNSKQDIVINVDPSSIPLSLILMCQQLSKQYSVFKSTFVHSSVSGQVPDHLVHLLTSNGGATRMNSQVSIVLVWKKVNNGPQLVVDPTRQTPISGEANIIRYLARLLNPSYDETDIIAATQTDEFLDLAQLQVIEGNSKEKSAAVRALNSALGTKSWLGGGQPGIADYVCWSALHQAGLAEGSPSNVKKWLGLCKGHESFNSALSVIG